MGVASAAADAAESHQVTLEKTLIKRCCVDIQAGGGGGGGGGWGGVEGGCIGLCTLVCVVRAVGFAAALRCSKGGARDGVLYKISHSNQSH